MVLAIYFASVDDIAITFGLRYAHEKDRDENVSYIGSFFYGLIDIRDTDVVLDLPYCSVIFEFWL